MIAPLKWKHRKPKGLRKNGQYRARTGPTCCNSGCPAHNGRRIAPAPVRYQRGGARA